MVEKLTDEKLEHIEELADLWLSPASDLRRCIGPYATTLARFARDTKEVVGELKQTREALRFYADKKQYSREGWGLDLPIEEDRGRRARTALNPPDEKS